MGTRTAIAALLLLIPSLPLPADTLPDAVHRGDSAAVRALLAGPEDLAARDARGNTALHWAALQGHSGLVKNLVARGAPVDATNHAGATPLLYAVGQLDSVRALIDAGADVNHASTFGTTPLIAAARHAQSSAVVRALLDRGAEANAGDNRNNSALRAAGTAGDVQTYRMLLEKGAKPDDLAGPAMYGHRDIVEAALDAGANVNANEGFAGHALNFALYGQQPDIARLLIGKGADLRRRSPAGQHETPPILWAAYNESGDASVARLMIGKGVDVHMQSMPGETALDWAIARGNRTLEALLREAGARTGTAAKKQRDIPQRLLPETPEELDPLIRESIDRAVRLLQHSSDVFLRSGVVRSQKCVSCHHQTLPAVAFAWARERGRQVDEPSIARLVQDQVRFWSAGNKVATTYDMIRPQPDPAVLLGYGLLTLESLDYPPDDLTEAMVWYLAATQRGDGSWPASDYRPPMEDGPIQGTAFALHSLRLYPLAGRDAEIGQRIDRARAYLRRAQPVTFNQEVFRLLGLGWAGERPRRLRRFTDAILGKQRPDGGWAQLEGLPGDAWATGQALVALHLAGGLQPGDPVYQRGIRFLLRTQFEDGSWFVRSRAWPFQPHFESRFPHGKDQWISAGGTAWAVMALLLTQPRLDAVPSVDWMTFPVPREPDSSEPARATATQPATGPSAVDYARDIKPVLTRSCSGCHDGDRQKGGFSIASRAALLRGGQSGEPAVQPGHGADSNLIKMVSGQVEDLEMPPLGKRDKNPALTPEEVESLKRWIDEGLPWPDAAQP